MKLKKLLTSLVLLVTASVSNASLVALDISATDTKLALGEMITLKLVGDKFDLATIGGGVNLRFAPDVLRVDNVSFDNSDFDFQKQVNAIDNDNGLVESILVSSILSEQSGKFIIAEIKFTAIGIGTSDLTLAPSTFFAPWRTPGNADIDFDFVNSSIQVVPVPAAIWFLLTGVAALGVFRKPFNKSGRET